MEVSWMCDMMCGNPAILICHCDSKSTSLCMICLSIHYSNNPKAIHVQTPISSATLQGNSLCEICNGEPEFVCLCKGNSKYLCRACRIVHIDNEPTASHYFEKIDSQEFIHCRDDIDQYLKKKKVLENIQLKLNKNIKKVSNYKEELETEKIKTLKLIENIFSRKFMEADSIENELTEMRKNIFAGQVKTKESGNWTYQPAYEISLETLEAAYENIRDIYYKIDAENLTKHIGYTSQIFYERYEEIQTEPVFLQGASHNLAKYDIARNEMNISEIEGEPFNYRSAWCVLPNGSIFLCGGQSSEGELSSTYILDQKLKTSTPVESMISPRKYHGVCYHNDYIYVFGGKFGGKLKSSERFSPIKQRWEMLPNSLYPHCHVSTLVLGNKILIAGYSRFIEIFDTDSLSYEETLYLPESTCRMSMFSMKGEIYLMIRSSLYKIDLLLSELTLIHVFDIDIILWFPSKPIENSTKIYFFSVSPAVVKLLSWGYETLYSLDLENYNLNELQVLG
ncbi:unnamed protein product [Blepharisma stoltei]|uniref:B box-type domain-containing protein n=1 Tax=Blepharisma stoltei TaxID=1481888 RepID=A0AAU9IK20_9CILI|nr:unnamed protein product [Blepharisma stoltei]